MATERTSPPSPLRVAEHFVTLRDPRRASRVEHPLITVVVIALVGVICGADGWDAIEEIAIDREEWLVQWLDLPNGVPSADTFRRVISALRPAAFLECVRSWVSSLAEPLDGDVARV